MLSPWLLADPLRPTFPFATSTDFSPTFLEPTLGLISIMGFAAYAFQLAWLGVIA